MIYLERMIVLQFIPSLNPLDGGTTTYMQQLAPALGALCTLHVCALGGTADFVPLEGCEVHGITGSLWHFRQMRREWLSLLDTLQPDVVHFNGCWMPQVAWVIAWTCRYAAQHPDHPIRKVLTPHGMLEPWIIRRHYWTRKWLAIGLYQQRAVRQCDFLVATAQEEREHLLVLGWNPRVEVVENGIDVHRIVPKTAWHVPRHFLFMSRVHPKKGLEMFLEAMREHPECRLSVAGNGEAAYIEELKCRVAQGGLTDCVRFLGPVYGDRKWTLLREADVVVLPSYSENYGLIVAEALACGTPVLTTTGTPWRSLQETGCGWWVAPDVPSLSSALSDCLNCTADEMSVKGRRSRELAENMCAIELKVNVLYNLYVANNGFLP